MRREWFYRICVLAFFALNALLIAASSVDAATVGVSIIPGALTISPNTVHLTYTVAHSARKHTVTSSFAVTVTDVTGTAAGWEIMAASGAAIGPEGQSPSVDHAIIDFDITEANGTPPNLTCVCDTISSSLGMILRTPPKTGLGRSTEVFTTQLTVPTDAAPGTYAATITLGIAPLGGATPPGAVNPLPGGRPSGPIIGGPVNPVPVGRPTGPVDGGTPSSLPVAPRPSGSSAAPVANITAAQPASGTKETSNITSNVTSSARPAGAAPILSTTANSDAQSAIAPPASVAQIADEPVAPHAATAAPSPTTEPARPAAIPINDTAPVHPVGGADIATVSTVGTDSTVSTGRIAPTAAPATIANDDAPRGPEVPALAVEHAYPVVTTVGNSVTVAPAPVASDSSAVGMNPTWHLQATATSAGRSAISRVFGHDTPGRITVGAVVIVVTTTGFDQTTVTFDPQQTDAEQAVIEPGMTIFTISIVAGP